jgi:hypothetical protein
VTRIQLAEAVRDYLGAEQVAAVLAGAAGPPVYECVTCRRPGDSRTEDTSAILWIGTDDPDDAVILSWAHARCAPSEVRPREELAAPGAAAAAAAVPARPDNTYASIADLRGGHTPTITIVPGTDTTAVLPDGRTRSTQLDLLRGYGFATLDLTSRDRPAGWAVRVDRGHLVSIGCGAVRWWTSPDPPPMPTQWRAAARAQRNALVMIVTPGVYDDVDQVDTADANAALRQAAATGRLVGGLLPVRGTLS